MLKAEYKILKYIKKHEGLSAKSLTKKFPYIDDYYFRIKQYIEEEPAINIYNEQICDKKGLRHDEKVICITLSGEEVLEKKQHEFWAFVLPYGITTLIAVSSVVAQIIDIFQ